MEIRILQEAELGNAAGLSRFVFDNALRGRMEFTQTISFVENYLSIENILSMYLEEKLVLWGVFEQEQLVGVSGMQSDGMITMLYILPQFTNRGFGNHLLQAMRIYAKEHLDLEKVLLNATPAWTSIYFQKQGFQYLTSDQNLRVPFVPMYAMAEDMALITKRRIPKMAIACAVIGCFSLATLATCLFMLWYLR